MEDKIEYDENGEEKLPTIPDLTNIRPEDQHLLHDPDQDEEDIDNDGDKAAISERNQKTLKR